MKILWVKSGGLVPLDHGGKIRSYHLARELARQHSVTLFTFYAEHPGDSHAQLEGIFARVVSVPLRIPTPRSFADYLGYARNLFSLRPYSAAKYCQPHVAWRLRQLLQQESFDVIVCDFLLTAEVIPWEVPCPKVLFTHNIEAVIWQRNYQVARNPLWKAVCYREYRAMERLEHRYLKRAEHVLAVSELDRGFFARLVDPEKITVVPTGVDVGYFQPVPEAERANVLVFTGSMDWLPNEESIFYFVEQVLPLVRKEIPEVSLWVVGRRPSARLQALAARHPGVRVTGTVEDIRPYMAQGSVYVVPLLVGGGTRLKIFEAMAMGKAVVSTSIGAEGLPVQHSTNILLADEPEEFAQRVLALLKEPARRAQLGRAARELVEQNYSWPSVAVQLEKVLLEAASRSRERLAAPWPSAEAVGTRER